MSDLGRQVMTQSKLSIHVESEDIFYENYNTGENFYNFLLTQQMMMLSLFLKNFHIKIPLKLISVSFYMFFL